MGRLASFTHVSIDGFFAGPHGEIDWFKAVPKADDYEAYTHAQAGAGDTLLMGRTTYEQMKSYWPTPEAIKADPRMAEVVDESPKIVFSKSLKNAPEGPHWKNITLLHAIDSRDIQKRKEQAEGPLTILGSGSIVQQLSNLGLIDEYCLVLVPVVLAKGKPLFEGVEMKELKLLESRTFENGLNVMRFEPRKKR
jgi:dihydrofolate reductase